MPENRDLITIAMEVFQLSPVRYLPVTESFSSNVLHFACAEGEFVLKQPFNRSKAERERYWLEQHRSNAYTSKLLDYQVVEGQPYLLLESRPGDVIGDTNTVSFAQAEQIGSILRSLHSLECADFDGFTDWHQLFYHNVNRYIQEIPSETGLNLVKLEQELQRAASGIPNSTQAVSIHLDFRPGNIIRSGKNVTGVIDLEAMRGGHPTMDFFKLWDELWLHYPELKQPLLAGYGDLGDFDLEYLMTVYRRYHGLGGLAWCAIRGQLDTDFAKRNYAHCIAG